MHSENINDRKVKETLNSYIFERFAVIYDISMRDMMKMSSKL